MWNTYDGYDHYVYTRILISQSLSDTEGPLLLLGRGAIQISRE